MKYIDFSVCGKKIECAHAGIDADTVITVNEEISDE